MDLATFRELLRPHGQAVLAAAEGLQPVQNSFLNCFEKLRKHHPEPLAKAALQTILLRHKAQSKFEHAQKMYFTSEALEQASGLLVSRYRARRFAQFATVNDLCSGIGADTISLAESVPGVEAQDFDELRLAMAIENIAVNNLTDRVRFFCGDVLVSRSSAEAAFIDPDRREGNHRHLDPNRYQPPLDALLACFTPRFPLAVKIAPGVRRTDLERWDCEIEFISAEGELKECVLGFGPFNTTRWRATLLPGPHVLSATIPSPEPEPTVPRQYIYDPDSAVIRADLVGLLAEQLEARPIDYGVAVLTSTNRRVSPFVDCYHVELATPYHAGHLRDWMRQNEIGRVTVLKRAVDLDTNEVTKKLKLHGSKHRHLILCRSMGRCYAIVAEKC